MVGVEVFEAGQSLGHFPVGRPCWFRFDSDSRLGAGRVFGVGVGNRWFWSGVSGCFGIGLGPWLGPTGKGPRLCDLGCFMDGLRVGLEHKHKRKP